MPEHAGGTRNQPGWEDVVPGDGPLSGVRVIDFTEYIAGPYATMMLADMGADVIKVEPLSGDHWRHQAPVAENESKLFLGLNRGKRSVSLDYWSERGREIVHTLVRSADVVIVNFRPGLSEQLQLDERAVHALRPTIVYADITAFGRHGPYSHRGGFDLLSQAATGIMATEGRALDGAPTGVRSFAPADFSTAQFTAFAIVAALFRRAQTGRGEAIRTNLFASALAVQYRPLVSVDDRDTAEREAFVAAVRSAQEDGADYEQVLQLREDALGRSGFANYYRVYQSNDGFVAVACLNNRLRRALRDLLTVDDPSVDGTAYSPAGTPVEEHMLVREALESAFHERTTDDWLQRLDDAGVPAARFSMTEEMYRDPHVLANDLLPALDHPTLGPVRMPRTPIAMRDSRTGTGGPAPVLGADTRGVLLALGLSATEINELVRLRVANCAGVPAQHGPD